MLLFILPRIQTRETESPFLLSYDRMRQHEIPYCDWVQKRLQTGAARAYLAQKRAFIESAIRQLALELEGVSREIWLESGL